MQYIGLDVHKDNITVCGLSPAGKPKFEVDLKRTDQGWSVLGNYIRGMNGNDLCFMMESGTYAYLPYRIITDMGYEAHVVHAQSLKMITDTDKKTDKKDAFTIARMLRLWKKGDLELKMSYIPTREQCELKDLCRYREEISKKISDETRRIKSHMARNCQILPNGCDNFQTVKARKYVTDNYPSDFTLMQRMRSLNDMFVERDRVKKEVESRMTDSKDVELLSQIPGIGDQTAVQIMSMIIDVSRFPDAEKLCAYFGMVPRVRDSGGKQHHGGLSKNGDRMMRAIMERVTESHIRNCDSSITRYYNRIQPRMGTKKALITASVKMLEVIYAVLKRGTPFRP